MARERITHDPQDLAERVANAALDAARKHARGNMSDVKEMIVLVRLDNDEAASAMGGSEEIDGVDLAAMLLQHFKVVMESMGKEVHLGFLERQIGHG